MKYLQLIIFLPHLKIFVIYIIIFSINTCYSFIEAHHHITTRLNNGNFLVFTSEGKYTMDPAFNLYNKTNDISCNNYHENLAHFSEEDGGYILFISNSYHHILSPYGELLIKCSFDLPNSNYYYYDFSVIPYNHVNDLYYYYLIYI